MRVPCSKKTLRLIQVEVKSPIMFDLEKINIMRFNFYCESSFKFQKQVCVYLMQIIADNNILRPLLPHLQHQGLLLLYVA